MNKSFFLMLASLVIIALCYPLLARRGFTQLPGDFAIQQGEQLIYLPFTTAFLVSVIVVIVFHLFK